MCSRDTALVHYLQQSVEPTGVDGHHGLGAHRRFGVVGHRQTGHAHHGQVVGTVSHGNGLVRANAHLGAGFQQHLAFLVTVANVAPGLVHHAAGEQAALGFQVVGAGGVDVQ